VRDLTRYADAMGITIDALRAVPDQAD